MGGGHVAKGYVPDPAPLSSPPVTMSRGRGYVNPCGGTFPRKKQSTERPEESRRSSPNPTTPSEIAPQGPTPALGIDAPYAWMLQFPTKANARIEVELKRGISPLQEKTA